MDITLIVIIVLGVALVGGGLIAGHLASKASEKLEKEEKSKKNHIERV